MFIRLFNTDADATRILQYFIPGTFQPEHLKYFSKSLITKMVAEAPLEADPIMRNSNDPNNKVIYNQLDHLYGILQRYDMYQAMKYAENTILPNLQKVLHNNFWNIDQKSNQLIIWIKEIHKRIANTLAIDINQHSGEYGKQISTQWVHSADFINRLIEDMSKQQSLDDLFNEYNLSHIQHAFETILKNLYQNEIISIPTEILNIFLEEKEKNPSLYFFMVAINKLTYGMHQNVFSEEEKKIISAIVKVRMLPEKIPEAMQTYANDLVNQLISCDGSKEKVVELAAQAFYHITEIHPFFNGNGRTGAILVNLILVYFGYPSIVLRNENDTSTDNSTYNQAIACINISTELLEKHIESKLQQAMTYIPTYEEVIVEDNILKGMQEAMYLIHQLLNNYLTKKNIIDFVIYYQREIAAIELDISKNATRKISKEMYVDEICAECKRITNYSWKYDKKKRSVWIAQPDDLIFQEFIFLLKNATVPIETRKAKSLVKPILILPDLSLDTFEKLRKIKPNLKQESLDKIRQFHL